jgi:hypothetical protein
MIAVCIDDLNAMGNAVLDAGYGCMENSDLGDEGVVELTRDSPG